MPSGFFKHGSENTNKLVMECFSICSSADIAKVSDEIHLGLSDIRNSEVLCKISSPYFSNPLLMSASVIIPTRESFQSKTPVSPSPFSDILNNVSLILDLILVNGIASPL